MVVQRQVEALPPSPYPLRQNTCVPKGLLIRAPPALGTALQCPLWDVLPQKSCVPSLVTLGPRPTQHEQRFLPPSPSLTEELSWRVSGLSRACPRLKVS